MAILDMIVSNTSFSAATKGGTISYDQQEPGCTDPKPTHITIVNQLPIGNYHLVHVCVCSHTYMQQQKRFHHS
jgi:hypothetical protein